jgi:hypothetical protein
VLPATTPGISHCSLVAVVSVIRPTLAFCLILFLVLDVKYFKDYVPFIFMRHQGCHHHPYLGKGLSRVRVLFCLT